MAKIALLIEYEGTRYHGFQIQNQVPTVQGEIEKAIWKVTGERIRIQAAGRTDAGVHAKGQVVAFETSSKLPPATFVKALNFYLPEDIAVKDACQVEKNFNPRRDALSREYCYTILNSPTPSPLCRNQVYFVSRPLDVEQMNKACQLLVGKHDFAPFTEAKAKNTRRQVFSAEAKKEGDFIFIRMVANSFLRQQVRRIVGCLIKLGSGKLSLEEFKEIASSGKPGLAELAVPSQGLCLVKVNYPEQIFKRS